MKRKLISVFLIVLMVLTVFSTVAATTKKVEAAYDPYVIVVGQSQKWSGRQCNYHLTDFLGPAAHYEQSFGNIALAAAYANPGQGESGNDAYVGVQWALKAPEGKTLGDVLDESYAVKITVSYAIAIKNGVAGQNDAYVATSIRPFGTGWSEIIIDQVIGSDAHAKRIALSTEGNTVEGLLNERGLSPDATSVPMVSYAIAAIWLYAVNTNVPQQALSQVTVQSIEVIWS